MRLQVKLVAIGLLEVEMWYAADTIGRHRYLGSRDVIHWRFGIFLEIYSPRKPADFVKFPNSEILIFRNPIFLKNRKEGKNKAKTKAFCFQQTPNWLLSDIKYREEKHSQEISISKI